MDWKEATDLGQEAARLIEDLTLIFEKISEGGYVVTPPTWQSVEESQVRPGNTKAVVTIELDGHLQIAKVIEPVPDDGRFGTIERIEVPPDIGTGPRHGPPWWRDGVRRWRAKLDDLTCDACGGRDGMTQTEADVNEFSGCNSPEGCRCEMSPPPLKPERPPTEEVHRLGGKIRPNSNKAGG